MHRCARTVWFDVVMSTETWVGADGTMRERSVEVSQRFASPADRGRWLGSGKPVPIPISIAQDDALDIGSGHFPSAVFGQIAPDAPLTEGPPPGVGPIDVGDGLFSYRQLLALPTGGTAALARIDQAWRQLRHRYAVMLLRWHSPGARQTARQNLAAIPKAGRSIQELLLIAHLDAAPLPAPVRLGWSAPPPRSPMSQCLARTRARGSRRPSLTGSPSALPLTAAPVSCSQSCR